MKTRKALIAIALAMSSIAEAAAVSSAPAAAQRNGQDDFTWEHGRWTTSVRVLPRR